MDDKIENISTSEYRALEDAPISTSPRAFPNNISSSEAEDDDDAGLEPLAIDAADVDTDSELARALGDDMDEDVSDADMDDETIRDEGEQPSAAMSTPAYDVVLESDLNEPDTHIHSPDLDAPDTPGEVDIEDLDESDLEGAGLPPDALLDPLED